MNPSMEPIQKLHYDVMGIGLAVRAIEGEGPLFALIDQALSQKNERLMKAVFNAFNMLNENQRQHIMNGTGDESTLSMNLARMERYIRVINSGADVKSA